MGLHFESIFLLIVEMKKIEKYIFLIIKVNFAISRLSIFEQMKIFDTQRWLS